MRLTRRSWRAVPAIRLFARHGLFGIALVAAGVPLTATERPEGAEFRNSLGMRFVRIEPGRFRMGESLTPLPEALTAGKRHRRDGDPDERPAHPVSISRPFYIGAVEITNAQYEAFDPAHRALRGRLGFSSGDDDAVVFVSWHDAVAFCEWLSKREGRPYRLPTEAEWEYATRAGSTTHFHTGDTLPEAYLDNPGRSWYPHPRRSDPQEPERVSLRVGKTAPNQWGLHDVHGNVEEWVHDWYGPYPAGDRRDPAGSAAGDFRVTRGGSHSTEPYFLRSANRSGTVPEDRSWLIGFRVALGPPPDTAPWPAPPAEAHQRDVRPGPESRGRPDSDRPFFSGPRRYVNIPEDSWGPLFSKHNHDPALVDCPNGDLLAVWYSCVSEPGRELGLLASRLRRGAGEWEPASVSGTLRTATTTRRRSGTTGAAPSTTSSVYRRRPRGGTWRPRCAPRPTAGRAGRRPGSSCPSTACARCRSSRSSRRGTGESCCRSTRTRARRSG